MCVALTSFATDVVNVALLVLYLVAAYTRYKVCKYVPSMRRTYWLSVPMALFFAGSYVWIMIFDDTDVRRLILRALQIAVLLNVWIWPALVKLQTSNLERLSLQNAALEHRIEVQQHLIDECLSEADMGTERPTEDDQSAP